MSLVKEAVWTQVKDELKALLPQVLFEQWFSGAEILSWDGRHLELGVQNRFFKSRIETTYLDTVKQAAEQALACEVTVSVAVSKRLLAAFRKAQKEAESAAAAVSLETPPSPEPRPKKPARPAGAKLNPEYTFDSFVVGASNRLSHAVAMRAVENPGEFARIYFCGQHGVGKSHLIHAICHEIRAARPDASVVYITADRFVADFTAAFGAGTLKEFRRLYRKCDVFALDDVQALGVGNKAATQAELLSILDELASRGKQVVLGATQTPDELDGVDAKLRDRFCSGFIDKISLPDEETRRQMIVKKLTERRIDLPKSAVSLLAKELNGNVRKMEGTLQRLIALLELGGMEPTTACIRMALEVSPPAAKRTVLAYDDIVQAVSDEFGLPADIITGRSRTAAARRARQVAVVLCRRLIGGSYSELGILFGRRTHATIISMMKNTPGEYFSDGLAGRPVERILFRLGLTIKPEDILDKQLSLFPSR